MAARSPLLWADQQANGGRLGAALCRLQVLTSEQVTSALAEYLEVPPGRAATPSASTWRWPNLTWFLATLGAALAGNPPAAYMEHLGGFLRGMVLGVGFMFCGIAGSHQTDPALSALFRGASTEP